MVVIIIRLVNYLVGKLSILLELYLLKLLGLEEVTPLITIDNYHAFMYLYM